MLIKMNLLISDYYSLLPDITNILVSFIPTISYFTSIKFYETFFHKGTRLPDKKYIDDSSKNMISSTPANIFLTFPIFNYFNDIEGLSFFNILLGIFIVDTLEYFFHYLLHKNSFFYSLMHNVHHKPVPLHPRTSFSNHDLEVLMTSPVILVSLVFFNLSFHEYILVTALSFSATVCDHTDTSRRKFHYIHHHVNKNTNFQQPFFTFWDHLFGTYYPGTELKIPFVP